MRAIGLLLLLSSTAMADGYNRELDRAPDGYVSAGAIAGTDHFSYGGVVVEAGRRVGALVDTPLFLRAMFHAGGTKTDDNPGNGTYVEGRMGIEGRNCIRGGMFCASVGIDVGLHQGRYDRVELDDRGRPIGKPVVDAPSETTNLDRFDSMVVAPRLTLDGGNRVRVRAVVERPYHIVSGGEGVGGVAGSLMLGLAF